jgi:hypothetical protein
MRNFAGRMAGNAARAALNRRGSQAIRERPHKPEGPSFFLFCIYLFDTLPEVYQYL